MKKRLALTLAAAFVFSTAGTVFAANPFVDVPANHWSYNAVNSLAKAGLVDGMGDGTFQGNKEMTRYEMAQIVAKAMVKADKADAANKALLNKLEAEYTSELNNLGVKVAALENKISSVKFSGDSRIRWQTNQFLKDDGNYRIQERVRFNLKADVAKNVGFVGRIDAQWSTGDRGANNTNTVDFGKAYFIFKNVFPHSNVEIGRNSLFVGKGLAADASSFDSVKVTFGNKLKGYVMYGDAAPTGSKFFKASYKDTVPAYVKEDPANPGHFITVPEEKASGEKTANIMVANLNYDFSKKLGVDVGYISPTTNRLDDYRTLTVAVDYEFNKDWAMYGVYGKTDCASDNKGYYTKLKYKDADKAKVGSWGTYIAYRDFEAKVFDSSITTLFAVDNTNGVKGLGFGGEYTIAKNTVFNADFGKFKTNKASNNVTHDFYSYVKLTFNF